MAANKYEIKTVYVARHNLELVFFSFSGSMASGIGYNDQTPSIQTDISPEILN